MTYRTDNYRNNPNAHLPLFHRLDTRGMNLVPNYSDFGISDVIVLQGPMHKRATSSAERFGYSLHLIESFNFLDRTEVSPHAYDNVKIKEVFPPLYYESQEWTNQVRLKSRLNHNQVCRILTHMAAWSKCMSMGKPCIILEHDAILMEPLKEHVPRNSIHCLSDDKPLFHNSNWPCMGEPFAYSVDNHSAKRLFNKVMEEGLVDPLEVMIRLDQFMIIFDRKSSRIRYMDSSAATLDSSDVTLFVKA
jgi:hypothetical protein